MVKQTADLNQVWSFLIIEELIRNGVNHFCISPGSRSTPLTVEAARNPQAETTICFDERGAAFHALGYARATETPAVLICTSGTAAANYFPAIIEASQDAIPLIILSADRPPELRKTGANQTIDQVKIYGDYVNWHFDLPAPDANISPQMVLTTIDQAIFRSVSSSSGPVHINCMFREPFVTDSLPSTEFSVENLQKWNNGSEPYTCYEKSLVELSETQMNRFANIINTTKKGIVVVGKLKNKNESDAVFQLIKKINWPVFADITSGLRFGYSIPNLIYYFDLMLLSNSFKQTLDPEIIFHIGGQFVSKRLLDYLQNYTPEKYLLLNDNLDRYDPGHVVTNKLTTTLRQFCKKLLPEIKSKIHKQWLDRIKKSDEQIFQLTEKGLLHNNQLSEISVAQIISQNIPEGTGLFLANSMPVRDMDMYALQNKNQVIVGSNRGASGIDGTIASAAGFASGLKSPVTLLIGDLAFIHDLNSLALLSSITHPVVIIIINNHGGGIFSFLPIARQKDVFEKYFATPHRLNFKQAASLFNLEYHQPQSVTELLTIYASSITKQRSTIIEIETDRDDNYQLHKQIETKIIDLLEN